MNEAYVKQYASLEKTHWWFVVRKKIIRFFILQQLPPGHRGSFSILNVGAAGGASSEWLAEFGTIISLESEPLFIDHLRKQNLEVVEGSVEQLPFPDNQFDMVCAFDVLEHVKEDAQAFAELIRVGKPGALICITVPAFNFLWSYHDELNGHYRRYNLAAVRKLFDRFHLKNPPGIYYFNFLLFLPVLVARKCSNLFAKQKKTGQSDFTYYNTGSSLNKLFEKIFSLELKLFRRFRFPFGVSLIAVLKKDSASSTGE